MKRTENGGEKESVEASPLKKPRFENEIKRVAEIVLVLSALRNIRGGKTPTELEMEMMVEAKSKLVEICQEFTPNDLIGKDAVKAVIEDLGLNDKVKDQRLGFRAPKLTISEKLSLGQRKMEESKKHSILSTSYTSPGPSTSANSVSMAHQWQNSEMKASSSSVNASGNHFVRDASGITHSRMERPQFKSDMHTSASQGQIPTGNYFGNATSWPTQPHSSSSTISFGTASDNKVPVQNSSRVTDPSFRPFMSQTPPGTFPGMKGVVTYGQTSSSFGNNHHAEIAKIIHKVLQPQAKQNLLWNPPSREYMSKAMTCQMCPGIINEVETVLICDACEKGYHLKCLQANNMKGVPKSEWHCSRCVQLYNGKSFPPKYGRVMRSETTTKTSSSNTDIQLPSEKKVGKVDVKVVNQETVSHSETAKAPKDAEVATNQTIEEQDAAAISQTVEAEDAAAMSQMSEAEDAGTVKDEDACTVEAEDAGTVEAEDAVTAEAEDAVTTEAEDAVMAEAEEAAMSQDIDTNNESESPIGKDGECDDPLEPESVSANNEDKNSNIIAESALQEENSEPSQPPFQQYNTDLSQHQNTTPTVQDTMQKNVTEVPQEDKSC